MDVTRKTTLALLMSGSRTALIVQVASAGLVFGLHVLLVRWLGVAEYGHYVEAMAWVAVLALLSRLGLETTLLKFVPGYVVEQRWGSLRGVTWYSRRASTAAAMALAALGWLCVVGLLYRGDRYKAVVFGFAFATLPFAVLTAINAAVLRALRRVFLSLAADGLIRPAILILSVLLYRALIGGPALHAWEALAFQLLAVCVVWAFTMFVTSRSMPAPTRTVEPAFHGKEWWRVASPLFILSALYLLIARTDIIMIGSMLSEEAAGLYGVAMRIAGLVMFGFLAVETLLAPLISELYTKRAFPELQHMVTLATRAMLFFALVIGLFLLFAGSLVLKAFGPGFVPSYQPMLILVVGHVVNCATGSVGHLMVMTRHQKQITYIMGLTALTNIALNAILIPLYGINGAAYATASATILGNGAMLVYVIRKLKIDPTPVGTLGSSL